MILPIPYVWAGNTVYEVEYGEPQSGVLADTRKAVEAGYFTAMHTLVSGVLTDVNGETDRGQMKVAVREMPYRDAEFLAIQAAVLVSPDDGFEGSYKCPRCGHQVVTEYSEDEEMDTRDFVGDLEVGYCEEPPEAIYIELKKPVSIKSKGEVLDTIETLSLEHPTMQHCMAAERRIGHADSTRLQHAIYAEALKTVNGREVDKRWKSQFGTLMFERMSSFQDMRRIGDEVQRYGLDQRVEKHCPQCGKVWKADVDTSNFFASALR